MYRLIMILSIFIAACSNPVSQVGPAKESQHADHQVNKVGSALQLNNGSKWKTDDATRHNIAALLKEMSDQGNIGLENKGRLARQLQLRIDTLVQQCTMEGPDHNALHIWLQQLLLDLKKMNEDSSAAEYEERIAVLKKDLESFYLYFE